MTDDRPPTGPPMRAPWLPLAALLAAISAWLWPLGVGGRMPIGEDATQFTMGLMAVLGRALKAGRLPLWNDLWGFGFPGLAESQMGVFYPPHLALYGLGSLEVAYTTNLVLHAYFGAVGAYWAGRRLGISPWGAALAGFAWGASGLAWVHLPHQWAYTTGAWMPWALGLAWTVARHGATLSRGCALAAILTLQVLPGHFQYAFFTQVAALGVGLWALIERPRGGRSAWISALTIAGAVGAVLPMAAMQLWPTMQLARTVEATRTFDYLSAFAAPPPHLVSYVAPGLFHRSPLWRSLAWDPFHAMPEEHLPYIGLVPLMLALGAIRRERRRDPAVRLLAGIALGATVLSFGPYVPGFRLLIGLPGFSFFRAPARWGLLAELALALLAGKGFDAWRSWPRPGWGMAQFAIGAAAAIGLAVGLVWLALDAGARPEARIGFEGAMGLLPWKDAPGFADVTASARRPSRDPLVVVGLIRSGVEPREAARMTLDGQLREVLTAELGETAATLLALLALAPVLARWPRRGAAILLALSAADLLAASRHRALGDAPIRPLTEQSAVLGRLAAMPPGSRTVDSLGNLPQVAGAAGLVAYHTLDRPALTGLVALASAPGDGGMPPVEAVDAALRAVGAAARVDNPLNRLDPGADPIPDPALASWIYGAWAEGHPTEARFWFRETPGTPTRAWFLPGAGPDHPAWNDPTRVLDLMATAVPARFEASRPERFEAEARTDGPGALIVSVLDDPEWSLERIAEDGRVEPVPGGPRRVFGGAGGGAWQGVTIPGPGRWRYRWTYRGRDVAIGLAVSAAAWLAWAGLLVAGLRGRRRVD